MKEQQYHMPKFLLAILVDLEILCPLMSASPEVIGNVPQSMFIVVDLPAPFAPRNDKTSPSRTLKLIFFTAFVPSG